MQIQHEFIRDRAYFVAGRSASFRSQADPVVESAIRDAEDFIATLPDDLAAPVVSGGTSVSKSNVLVLTWLVIVRNNIKAITVTFFGHGICNVSWPESQEPDRLLERIPTEKLKSLDMPAIVSSFRPAGKATY
jgi:hypothetical protein